MRFYNCSTVSGIQVKIHHSDRKSFKLLWAKHSVTIMRMKIINRKCFPFSTFFTLMATPIWLAIMPMTWHCSYWTNTLNSIHLLCQFVCHKISSTTKRLFQLVGAESLPVGVWSNRMEPPAVFSRKSNCPLLVEKIALEIHHLNLPISSHPISFVPATWRVLVSAREIQVRGNFVTINLHHWPQEFLFSRYCSFCYLFFLFFIP